MAEIFYAKLRKIGNSLGVIIPNRIIERDGYRMGDMVPLVIPKGAGRERDAKLRQLVGLYRGKSAFVREHGDRY